MYKQFLFYRNFSKALEFVPLVKGHDLGCQPFGFGWMVHHLDFDLLFTPSAILTLHEDIFCFSYPQQVRGRHHIPAVQEGERERDHSTESHSSSG